MEKIKMEEILEIARKSFPAVEGSEIIDGIQNEVEILWDKWGIPHVYGNSVEDVFFTQGYIHASHRLFQMELFRRLTTGELSEVVGEAMIDSDKHYKIIGLHRIAERCAKDLRDNPDTKAYQWIDSYVKGVNAGIEKARKNPPIEFAILNLKIRDWRIEDTLKVLSLIEWGLSSWNYPLELLRESLILKLGVEMADKIVPLYSGVNFKNSSGSNGWVISPKKSKSGSVLFSNDPHLPLTLPAVWMLFHLNCPEFNIIGSSFSGLPMVVLGHNEKIAWGCTNVHADTTDLFRLELNPDNKNQYKYNGQWVDFELIDDPINVSEAENPLPYKILMTKFGPVVEYSEINGKFYPIDLPNKYALRWSSYDANLEDSLMTFIKVNMASNWSEFREALKKLTINPQNFVYGDINGNIGHQHAGKIPVRNYGDGATVTPGTDEKYNWKGLSEFEQLLSIYNPDHGFVYTANFNEDKAPNGLLLAQDTSEPYRQMRIKKLLQSKNDITMQDFIDFQLDHFTEEGLELLPIMLKHLKANPLSNKFSEIISLLENWDYYLTKTTVAGTIYKIWWQETIKTILIPIIGEDNVLPYLASSPFELRRLFKLSEGKIEELQEHLLTSLQNTISFLTEQLSPDHTKWKWGNLHKLTLVHPFSLAREEAKALNIGPFKFGGDSNTLNNGYYDPLSNFDVIVGPSYRQIHDLSDWDKSICNIPGGQSGLPFHKHYNDLIKLYVKGKYIPMLFTKDKIAENLEGIYKLLPK
jgi:penicillin amidase